ncbi:MAG: MotB family protein [Roseibium sp.]|uniref:MotB family protein n=1 Tax=Roseibium sp. TaxID=1936156 RepID=UPI0032985398
MLDGVPNEIVIVRRKNSWDDEHLPHGVWKIAYADFMTALMAFFLVMWLINVTDDSVRRGVAQYFNPVKLASTAPNRKGLNDPDVDGETNQSGTKMFKGMLGGSEEPVDQDANFGTGIRSGHKPEDMEIVSEQGGVPAAGQFTQRHAESILFSDPYAVLDTLADEIRVAETLEDNPNGIGTGLEQQEGAQGGQAYRDPFDPLFWQFRPGRGVDGAHTEADLATPGSRPGDSEATQDGPTLQPQRRADGTLEDPLDDFAPLAHAGSSLFEHSGTGPQAETGDGAEAVIAHVTGQDQQQAPETGIEPQDGWESAGEYFEDFEEGAPAPSIGTVVSRLSEVLEETDGTILEETASLITVTREGDSALISLTDDQNFGMFAIGSAGPRPELVKLLERIGAVIADTPGRIVIKGHTDARPFRSAAYDNWRLSSARAHMALYMLARGGVAKDRFDRIEGAADRHLKIATDPYAAGNRRVEIYLLETAE